MELSIAVIAVMIIAIIYFLVYYVCCGSGRERGMRRDVFFSALPTWNFCTGIAQLIDGGKGEER